MRSSRAVDRRGFGTAARVPSDWVWRCRDVQPECALDLDVAPVDPSPLTPRHPADRLLARLPLFGVEFADFRALVDSKFLIG
jgi:hypothetical protein